MAGYSYTLVTDWPHYLFLSHVKDLTYYPHNFSTDAFRGDRTLFHLGAHGGQLISLSADAVSRDPESLYG